MWQLIVFPRKETSYNTSISCGLNDWASVHFWDSLGRCERTTDMFLKHTFEYGILSPGQQICSLHPCVCPCITLKNIYYSSIVALQCVSLFCTAKWISYEYACMLICFSHFQLCESLWTVACQASLSMRFSRQEYWVGCLAPLHGVFPTQGWNASPVSRIGRLALPLAPPSGSTGTSHHPRVCRQLAPW